MDAQCPTEEAKLLFHHKFKSIVMFSQTPKRSRQCKIILKHRLEELQFFIRFLWLSEVPLIFFIAQWMEANAFSLILHIYGFGTLCNLKITTEVLDGVLGFAASEDQSYQGQQMQRTQY